MKRTTYFPTTQSPDLLYLAIRQIYLTGKKEESAYQLDFSRSERFAHHINVLKMLEGRIREKYLH